VEALQAYLRIAERNGVRAYLIPGWPHRYAAPGTLEDARNLDFIKEIASAARDDQRVLAWDMATNRLGKPPDLAVGPGSRGGGQTAHLVRTDDREAQGDRPQPPHLRWDHLQLLLLASAKPFTLESIVDFVDFHYYRRNYRESWLADEIRRVREHTDKPIIVGEFGFPTDPGFSIHGEPSTTRTCRPRCTNATSAIWNRKASAAGCSGR